MLMSKTKKTILYVSIYTETLKNILPFIISSKDAGFNVKILAKHYPFGDDKIKTRKLLEGLDYELIESLDMGDMPSWRSGRSLTSRWWRLWSTLLNSFNRSWQANTQSIQFLNRYKPDVIVLGSDGRILERYLIKNAKKRKIPSVCVQWTLSIISLNSILESKSRRLMNQKKHAHEAAIDSIYYIISQLVKIINSVAYRLAGLRTKLDIPGKYGIRIHGQGNADRLALIGESSRRFHLEMGTPSSKLTVIGSPKFDNQYKSSVEAQNEPTQLEIERKAIRKKYGLNHTKKLLLIANNDSKKQYSSYYSNEEIVASWRNRIERVLREKSGVEVIFKLHPAWNTQDEFEGLGVGGNLCVLHGGDMEELIKVTSVLVVRHSMAALDGIIQGVPTVSINTPPIPAGNFYKEVGGTIHANNDDEFISIISSLMDEDSSMLELFEQRRSDFIQDTLGVDISARGFDANTRFIHLLKEIAPASLTNKNCF